MTKDQLCVHLHTERVVLRLYLCVFEHRARSHDKRLALCAFPLRASSPDKRLP